MQLILVRHGETEWNKIGRCQGISDVPLNSTGIKQAEKLAESLKKENISAIFSSSLKRAFFTAQEIAKYHPVDIEIENKFREMDQGKFEGMMFDQIISNYSDIMETWREEPEKVILPDGESLVGVQDRAWSAFTQIHKNYDSEKVLIVSHNMTIITLLCKFSGKGLKSFREYLVDESSKCVINCENGDYSIEVFNDTSHLNSF